MGDEVHAEAKIPTLPFKPPEFDWGASNLYSQFRLFKVKYNYAFKGTYSQNSNAEKVGAILNWLGDIAFKIHSNFTWTTDTDKDNPDKVLDAFE